MHAYPHQHLKDPSPAESAAEERTCVIGPRCGVHDFQAWAHTLPPGALTPAQRHAGSWACLVLAGTGKLLLDGAPLRFQAPCTLVVPPGSDFQIANNGTQPLRLVSVFTVPPEAAAPAR